MTGRARDGGWGSLLPLGLTAISGFSGLGYQIVWTEQCALWLGHGSAAVLAVVAAFFGGLAVGAWVLGGRVEASPAPVRWYAGCELAVAAWALVLVIAMAPAGASLVRFIGPDPSPLRQWTLAFSGVFLALLPATGAMGATLPALSRAAVGWGARGDGREVAGLYAANTFGAVAGVGVTAYALIPCLGLSRSALCCAALNLTCAVVALVAPAPSVGPSAGRMAVRAWGRLEPGLVVLLASTGLLGIGYEVLVVRALSRVAEDTVYTFATLLAVYLVGTAAGAAGYQRWLDRRDGAEHGRDRADAAAVDRRTTERLVAAVAAACLLGAGSLWAAPATQAGAAALLGPGVIAAVVAEAVPAVLAFAPASVSMGALFGHLCRRASASGAGVGPALAVNTLAASGAPWVFGVIVLPALGFKWAFLVVVLGYLALVARSAWFRRELWISGSVTVVGALLAPPLVSAEVPEGGRLVSYEDGAMASVSVVEDASGVARLRIDDRAQEGSSATGRVDARQAWLPLLLHPRPRRALFLGLGTGVTASSAAEDPTLYVDAVELLPEVIRASAHFSGAAPSGARGRLHLHVADARSYVRASQRRYDVIVADNVHPARSGSGSLYTVEHFEALGSRLDAGGLLCQWLPLHQLDQVTLRSIVRSFLRVYPGGSAVLASNSLTTPVLGLIGPQGEGGIAVERLRARLAGAALPARLASIGFEDDLAVLGSFVAGPASLAKFSAGAPENTDDRPTVAYAAPRATYAPDLAPGQRLVALLGALSVAPAEVLSPPVEASMARRLAAYWAARGRFVEAGREVTPSPRVEEMLAQVRAPLLDVLQVSPDFRPAYDPLLSMAAELAGSDVTGALALLEELSRLQPAREEAARLASRLRGPGEGR